MLSRSLFFWLVLCLLLPGLAACTAEAETGASIPLEPCRLPGGVTAQCGVYRVPENRVDNSGASDGRTISLHIAVIPATTTNNAPDPLFLLAGGPGQAATEVFPLVLQTFETINRTRDLVLVDQRGTGQSNPIECANFAEIELDAEPTDEEVAQIVNTCLTDLEADPTLYTTDIAMRDLDEVRVALGYDQINLFGISYGTRAALHYLRLYPAHVRTVILDAVTAPELVLFLQAPRDGQQALAMMFDRCSADSACREQFPNLRAEFDDLFASLAEPKPTTVIHPVSGEAIELTVTQDVLMQSLFNALYSSDIVALLPLLIHQAYTTGDVAPLVAQALVVGEGTGIYYGLLYSVTCAEDAPLIRTEEAELIRAGTQFPLMAESFLQVCAHWPRGMVSADFRQPVHADVPALLLSGEADPITPPRYAEQVADMLLNNLHLVLPGYGHGVSAVGCMPDIIARFITSGTVTGLDTGCLAEVEPPPFFVAPSGPQP